MIQVPRECRRLADEIDGWLDLRCPDRALALVEGLLTTVPGRPVGLTLRARAFIAQGNHRDALQDLLELRSHVPDLDWLELTEAWCRKRLDDLPGAIACMERLLAKDARSAIGHFNLGCYLALHGEHERAMDEVTLACGLDEEFRTHAKDEPDLDCLRTDDRFRQLLRN